MSITRLHGRSSTLVANPRRKRRNPEEVAATKKKKRRKMAAWSRSSFIGPRTTKQLEHMTRLKRRKLVASTRAAHKAMIARVEGKIPAGSHKVAYLYQFREEPLLLKVAKDVYNSRARASESAASSSHD